MRALPDEQSSLSPALKRFFESLPHRADEFQLEAARAISRGDSVLVAAPTGAGKTVVAECAVEMGLEESRRVFYTTPIKALSNQKFRDLSATYGKNTVGLLTGDNSVNPEAPLVVMTTEVLRNMIYEGSDRLKNLGFVILDEVHYLQDRYRGAIWEEVIIELDRSVTLVCLSATVSNASEFGRWLNERRGNVATIVERARPVPLHNLYGVDDRTAGRVRLMSVFDAEAEIARKNPAVTRLLARGRRRGRRGLVGAPRRVDLVEVLAEESLIPAIYFIFSRAGCEDAVRACSNAGIVLTTREEREHIRAFADERLRGFEDGELSALGYEEWLAAIESGIAAHHAGMIPAFKEIVEELFNEALIKVVFATETLALGINMPAKSVTLESLSKFNGRFHALLTPGEYTQLAGRAGRRGIDEVGYCIVLRSRWVPFERVAEIAGSRAYDLRSSFVPSYNMATNLIRTRSREATESTLEASFAQFQMRNTSRRLEADLEKKRRVLERHQEGRPGGDSTARNRWAARDSQLQGQVRKLERRITRKERGLIDRFDALLAVLTEFGYVESWSLTSKGQILAGIYSERDLLVAEALSRRVDDALRPAEAAALASCFVWESRSAEPASDTDSTAGVRSAIRRVLELWGEVTAVEERYGVEPTPAIDASFASTTYRWASGERLETILEDGDSAGDFVRGAKQVVDICRQISAVGGGEVYAAGGNLVNRGVVAYSSI